MTSRLLDHLPGIYQSNENEHLRRFLGPMEATLFAPGNGLSDRILNLPEDVLDPSTAKKEFLPWLASWVGLSLRSDLPLERRRALIELAVPLYVWRGTMFYVKTLLELVTGALAKIVEPDIPGLRVGAARVGSTTRLKRDLPHYFEVTLEFTEPADGRESWLEGLAQETIHLAKPAHTYYRLAPLRFVHKKGGP
jgi:phage tail-like protein